MKQQIGPNAGGSEAQNKRRPAGLRGREKGNEGKEGKKNDSQVQQDGWWSLPGNRKHCRRAKLEWGDHEIDLGLCGT